MFLTGFLSFVNLQNLKESDQGVFLQEQMTKRRRREEGEVPSEPRWKRWARYEDVTLEDRSVYFDILKGTRLSKVVEDDLEVVSGVVSQEALRDNWEEGVYQCARCENVLYRSDDKWEGPCVWPSFRQPANEEESLLDIFVPEYNGYTCAVFEVYCKKCQLFLGHRFEDGKEKGDQHEEARWRH